MWDDFHCKEIETDLEDLEDMTTNEMVKEGDQGYGLQNRL